jgi:hypothetical protein
VQAITWSGSLAGACWNGPEGIVLEASKIALLQSGHAGLAFTRKSEYPDLLDLAVVMAFTTRVSAEKPGSGAFLIGAVVVGLLGLPLAVWLDLRVLSENMLRAQAAEISRIVDDMRAFYGSDVVGRLVQGEQTTAVHNYRDVPGAIPIPATLH